MPDRLLEIDGLPGRIRESHVKTLISIYETADKIPPEKLVAQMREQFDALKARGASDAEAVRTLRTQVTGLLVQAWVTGEMEELVEETGLKILNSTIGLIEVTYLAGRRTRQRVENLEQWRGATIGSLALISNLEAQVAQLRDQVNKKPALPSVGPELTSLETPSDDATVMFSYKPENTTPTPRTFRIIGVGPTVANYLNQLITITGHTVLGVSGAPDTAAKDGSQITTGYSSGPTITSAASADVIQVSATGPENVIMKWSAHELATDQRPDVRLLK